MKKEEQFIKVLEFALQKVQDEQKLTVVEIIEDIKDKLRPVLNSNGEK
ncbi:hypothetical protein [Bacillus infantis]